MPIVVLYLWRIRPRRHAVPAGFLWDRVFLTDGPRAAWWPWRRPVSLLIELAILALLVFALAEPLVRVPRRFVLIVDNSASMNATDVAPTRLHRAKQLARQRIAALSRHDQMAILSAGGRPAVRCGMTSTQAILDRAVQAVPATRGETRVAEAVALGRRLLAGVPGGKVLVLSDGCFDGSVELAAADHVELVPVGTPAGNVAVTTLAARRSLHDPSHCEVLVEITSFSDEPAAHRLGIEMDGELIDDVPVHLPAAGRWQRVFELTGAAGGQVSARLDGTDALAADNRASTRLLPAGSPVPVVGALPGPDGSGATGGDSRAERPSAVAWPGGAESDLRVPTPLTAGARKTAAQAAGPPVGLHLVAAAWLLVVLQWCLYQRRWVL